MLKKTIFMSLVFTTLLFMGCTSDTTPVPTKKKDLIVAMSVHYAPIAFRNKNHEPTGLEADFAQALAKELNRNLQIKVLPWEQLPMSLKTGVADIIMTGYSITSERSKSMLFSDPYMHISQMAVMRVGHSAPDTSTYGKGSRMGYVFSTTGENFVKNTFYNASHTGYNTIKKGIVAVMNGDIDYFFHDSPSIWFYTTKISIDEIMGWYVPYTDERLAWAFAPKNRELRDEINVVLDRWRKDGTLNRMIKKWIHIQVVTPNGQKPISFE